MPDSSSLADLSISQQYIYIHFISKNLAISTIHGGNFGIFPKEPHICADLTISISLKPYGRGELQGNRKHFKPLYHQAILRKTELSSFRSSHIFSLLCALPFPKSFAIIPAAHQSTTFLTSVHKSPSTVEQWVKIRRPFIWYCRPCRIWPWSIFTLF